MAASRVVEAGEFRIRFNASTESRISAPAPRSLPPRHRGPAPPDGHLSVMGRRNCAQRKDDRVGQPGGYGSAAHCARWRGHSHLDRVNKPLGGGQRHRSRAGGSAAAAPGAQVSRSTYGGKRHAIGVSGGPLTYEGFDAGVRHHAVAPRNMGWQSGHQRGIEGRHSRYRRVSAITSFCPSWGPTPRGDGHLGPGAGRVGTAYIEPVVQALKYEQCRGFFLFATAGQVFAASIATRRQRHDGMHPLDR